MRCALHCCPLVEGGGSSVGGTRAAAIGVGLAPGIVRWLTTLAAGVGRQEPFAQSRSFQAIEM